MPLGWRPEGLPPKPPIQEVTAANQVRFKTQMFWGAKPYLILHIVLGVALMMFIIDPNSPWRTGERWIGSFLLWHMIINWSGIMESKRWLFFSEFIRIVVTCFFLIYSSDSLFSPVNGVWIVISLLSAYWTLRYFRVYLPLNQLQP
jgi:hypothetical protein